VHRVVQIIVTPGSGEGRAMTIARHLQDLLRERGDDTAVRTYKSLGALGRWAKTCDRDFTHLVCVGGDATQSAAAAAAVRLSVPFLPVPSGFGNIFARAFGHPDRVEEVADLLDQGELQRVDVGMVDDEDIFLSHRSYGVLQRIQETVEDKRAQPRSRVARYLAYCGMFRRFLGNARPSSLAVEVDGRLVAEGAGLVTVANVETYRGFLSLTPRASPIDGLFDVFVVPRASKLRLGARLFWLLLKTPGRWNGLVLCEGRRVVVSENGRREALRALRHALPLLVPPGGSERLAQRTRERGAPVGSAVAGAS